MSLSNCMGHIEGHWNWRWKTVAIRLASHCFQQGFLAIQQTKPGEKQFKHVKTLLQSTQRIG